MSLPSPIPFLLPMQLLLLTLLPRLAFSQSCASLVGTSCSQCTSAGCSWCPISGLCVPTSTVFSHGCRFRMNSPRSCPSSYCSALPSYGTCGMCTSGIANAAAARSRVSRLETNPASLTSLCSLRLLLLLVCQHRQLRILGPMPNLPHHRVSLRLLGCGATTAPCCPPGPPPCPLPRAPSRSRSLSSCRQPAASPNALRFRLLACHVRPRAAQPAGYPRHVPLRPPQRPRLLCPFRC